MCAKHADMEISRPKTFAMTIRKQIEVPHTKPEEYQTLADSGVLKFNCVWCYTYEYFHSANAVKVHHNTCIAEKLQRSIYTVLIFPLHLIFKKFLKLLILEDMEMLRAVIILSTGKKKILKHKVV